MYILYYYQNGEEHDLAVFESLENIQNFVKAIPTVEYSEDEFGFSACLYPDKLPDYTEVKYKDYRYPLTKYMFKEQDRVELYYNELVNLDNNGNGLVSGCTRVDAYIIDNYELKEYISNRETLYNRTAKILNELGYNIGRFFAGSEDGEAIMYSKYNSDDWNFLTHMDSIFVDDYVALSDEDLKNEIKKLIAD